MRKIKSMPRGHPTLVVLVLLLVLVVVVSVAGVAAAAKPGGGTPSSGTEYWVGHGSQYLTTAPGQYHWVLTAGGGGFEFTNAVLHVTYQGGGTSTVPGYFPGGSTKGAIHFNTPSGIVVSAYCVWNGTGTPGNMNLNISHFTPETTTTVSEVTTEPSTETTSTTSSTTTTTSSTTTTTSSTTTTTSSTTTTTTEETTTTTEETTSTTEETTTTTQSTTTTTGVTSTTTPTTEAGETTVPEGSSTTNPPVTGGETTTPAASQVQAGGGGTAGMGGGLWALLALAASLGLGLTASTLKARLSTRR